MTSPIFCLMGPTASGKTALAVEIVRRYPCEIISVDSAMVYRGMDIGTAKPDANILREAPHRLINLLDPKESYSAGQFCRDALREIEDIIAHGKIPLLVGGTMLYFRALQQGMAKLPTADASLRQALLARAKKYGWEMLHDDLAKIDADAAQRIHPNDHQRIQRALEVYELTGKTITAWQAEPPLPMLPYHLINIAMAPFDRTILHERIALRCQYMLQQGFLEEAQRLYARGDLSPDLPSMRSVGYRETWAYFAGQLTYEAMCDRILFSTRQLAKRQLTWLRAWPVIVWLNSGKPLFADALWPLLDTY